MTGPGHNHQDTKTKRWQVGGELKKGGAKWSVPGPASLSGRSASATYDGFLPNTLDPNLMWPPHLTNSLQEIWGMEEKN